MAGLDSFSAVRYRGIDGLCLPKLSKANLITGANGIGKTALIEAIWLFAGRYNPSLLWNANVQRSVNPPLDPISRLTDGELELRGVENGNSGSVKFNFERMDGIPQNERNAGPSQEDPRRLPPVVGFIHTHLDGKAMKETPENMQLTPFGVVLCHSPKARKGYLNCVIESTRFQNEAPAEFFARYSNLVREGRKKELVKAIKLVAKEIEDVEILADESGLSYLSLTIKGEKPRPLHDLGGGAVRLVRLLLGFSASRDGVLLLDELENGIHYSAQQEIWNRVRRWMDQWNVQVMATTHSGEFIDSAIEAFSDRSEDLAIHNLFRRKKGGQLEAATFTGKKLLGARELDLEVR